LIGLDTNVWVRYIVQDDEQQAELASIIIEQQSSVDNPAFINEITLCEIVWVLKRAYKYDKPIILSVLKQFLNAEDILIASHTQVLSAYDDYLAGNADFSDYLIAQLNKNAGCQVTFSFDKKACQHENFKLILLDN